MHILEKTDEKGLGPAKVITKIILQDQIFLDISKTECEKRALRIKDVKRCAEALYPELSKYAHGHNIKDNHIDGDKAALVCVFKNLTDSKYLRVRWEEA